MKRLTAFILVASLTACGDEAAPIERKWWDGAVVDAFVLDERGIGIGLTNATDPDGTTCWPDQKIAVTNVSKAVAGKSGIGCYRIKGGTVEIVWLVAIECYLKEQQDQCETSMWKLKSFKLNASREVTLETFR